MDLNKLVDTLEVLKTLGVATTNSEPKPVSAYERFMGKYVLVRHDLHGVNVGYLAGYDAKFMVLDKSRKLWRWHCKESIALESVAKMGIKVGTRASHTVDNVIIPFERLCGVILVDEKIIDEIKNWKVSEQDCAGRGD